jgi:hypothetical protein
MPHKVLLSGLLFVLFAALIAVLMASCPNGFIKSWYDDADSAQAGASDTCDILLYHFTYPAIIGIAGGGSGGMNDRALINITYPAGTGIPGDERIRIFHNGVTVEAEGGWTAADGSFARNYTVTAESGARKYYRASATMGSQPPAADTCDIILYYFAKSGVEELLGVGNIDAEGGSGAEGDPVPISIGYPAGTGFPLGEDDIHLYHNGAGASVLGNWLPSGGSFVRLYKVTAEGGWVPKEGDDGVFYRDYTVFAVSDAKKYYRVTATEGPDTSMPGTAGRVLVFNHPAEDGSPESVYNARLYEGSLTAATFASPVQSESVSSKDGATSVGPVVEVAFQTGTISPQHDYVLLLKSADGTKNVGYFNGVTFANGIAIVSWNDMWHTFENAAAFKDFMQHPDSATNDGKPYRIALSGTDMETELSAGKAQDLYSLLKPPFSYRFDFRGCTGDSFRSIEGHANAALISEVYLNPGLKTVGKYAFDGCASLAGIELPSSVQTVDDYAFRNTTFTSIDFSPCTELTTIGASAFYASSLTKADFNGTKLKTIGASAFYASAALTEVNLTGTLLETIGDSAFYSCDSLTKADLSAVAATLKTVGSISDTPSSANGLFANCSSLSTVNLSSCANLEVIGDYAFYGCAQFKDDVDLAETGLKQIGHSAFSYSGIKSLDANKSALAAIGESAFMYCSSLAAVDLNGCASLAAIGNAAFSSCSVLAAVDLSGCASLETIGDTTLTSESYGAFAHCPKLTTINLSSCANLKTMGNYAFYQSGLTSFNLPNYPNLTTIGTEAFFYNTGLAEVDLSGCASLTTIGTQAFSYNTGLAEVDLSDCIALETINNAFSSCAALATVNLSGCAALASIANSAFSSCAALATVNLNGCATLASIGSSAFSDCKKLVSINFSGCILLETINSNAFRYCEKLATVDLTGTVIKTIGDYAFYGCTALTGVLEAANLSSVYGALTTIGTFAFYNSGVTSADLDGCTKPLTIGANAFGNSDLQTLKLPSSLTTVGDYAFSPCGSTLSVVYIYIEDTANLNSIFPGENTFGLKQNFTLHVPTGKANAYQTLWDSHTGWQKLATPVEEDANLP